jgi:hypothetical protein
MNQTPEASSWSPEASHLAPVGLLMGACRPPRSIPPASAQPQVADC